jgi:hypothetical protein
VTIQSKAFSTRFTGKVNVLYTPVDVSDVCPHGIILDVAKHPKKFNGQAIWDTGATNSVITEDVVKALSLQPTGRSINHGVHGPQQCNVYHISLWLPNKVLFQALKVTEVKNLIGNFKVLIGMDVIGMGDFAVTSQQGATVMSYQVPQQRVIDFVPSANHRNTKPNDQCFCKSGKKYKKCCLHKMQSA